MAPSKHQQEKEKKRKLNEEVEEDDDQIQDGTNDNNDDDDRMEDDPLDQTPDEKPSSRMVSDGRYRNKQRCLVVCSRGVTARYRHLLEDIRTLLPHHKKESKLDPGGSTAAAVNDICAMRGCNTVVFLECRKHQDAYLWLGRTNGGAGEAGPSARFHVTNIHTMDELRLTGNCMKHSRPILTFDEIFHKIQHLKLLKELFVDIFGTPRGHPKSKPFIDRIMAFYYADNRVSSWVSYLFV
jgi:ribosome biogenesis protein BRX1